MNILGGGGSLVELPNSAERGAVMRAPRIIKRCLMCGVAAGPFFVGAFLIQQMFRVGYDAMRDPVSSLSIGPGGWLQQVVFWVTGSLLLLFALGVSAAERVSSRRSVFGPILLGMAGVGLTGAGFFTTDPFPGYPLDLPYHLLPHTRQGKFHSLVSGLVFYGLIIATFAFGRYFLRIQERRWAAYSMLSGVIAIVTFVVMAIDMMSIVNATDLSGVSQLLGLWERLFLISLFQWTTGLGLHFLRRSDVPCTGAPSTG